MTDCWLWAMSYDAKGYGRAWSNGRHWKAHRLVYEALVGPVEEGLELDHLCKNRLCVNPDHLEPVTHKVNMERMIRNSYCGRGHEFTKENTYTRPDGARSCIECQRIRLNKWRGKVFV